MVLQVISEDAGRPLEGALREGQGSWWFPGCLRDLGDDSRMGRTNALSRRGNCQAPDRLFCERWELNTGRCRGPAGGGLGRCTCATGGGLYPFFRRL